MVLELLERLGTQDIVAQEPPATLDIAELLRLADTADTAVTLASPDTVATQAHQDTVATLALPVTAAIQAQALPVTQDIPVLRQLVATLGTVV